MNPEKVYQMPLSKVYPLLVAKVERKGRSENEVLEIIRWLTGYTPEEVAGLLSTGITYGEFFRDAPHMNPDRMLIKGTVCGVRVENIAEPLMRDIRYLDKLVDELAKGKGMDMILRKSFTDR
ncbi:putative uncharacterized protein [Prevotella sp. CAG:487]|nr:putative uncharacterized protein [Prevotella sp. CAG:487]